MTIRQIVSRFPTVFKPGYPTGRNEYMILDADHDRTIRRLVDFGIFPDQCNCGHDYNYKGGLYKLYKVDTQKGTIQ